MCYSLKNIFVGTALSLVLSVSAANRALAQTLNTNSNEVPGSVSLDLEAPADTGGNLPILEEDVSVSVTEDPALRSGNDMITPSAPANRAIPPAPAANNPDMGNQPILPPAENGNNVIVNDPLAPQPTQPLGSPTGSGNGQSNPLGSAPAQPVLPKQPGNDAVIPNTSATVDGLIRPEDDPLPDITDFGANGESGALSQIDTNLFSKMSTLEKQSALLSLELRREKIRNEIEAIKAQRQQAQLEQQAAEEEKQRKKQEWENEQKKKLMEEEQKLKEIEAQIEQLRQEKIIKVYKEEMLAEKQEWIKNNERIYQMMAEIENDREFLINDFKMKLSNLRNLASKTVTDARNARDRHNRDIEALKTKISVLQSRLDAELAEKNKTNPFAQLPAEKQVMLSDVYAIMEIVGKGENLAAKLINKNGDYFMVRKGTALQTGHVIDEISETYIRGDLNGAKDYLYFAAGGILDSEPVNNSVITKAKLAGSKDSKEAAAGGDNLVGTAGIPSLGEGLFVR